MAGGVRMSIWSALTSIRSIRAVRTARLRALATRASSCRFPRLAREAGAALRHRKAVSLDRCCRDREAIGALGSLTSCSISAAGMRSPAELSVRSFVISGRET